MFENRQTRPNVVHPPETIFTRTIEFKTAQSGNTERRDSDR